MTDKGIAGHFWRKSTFLYLHITIFFCKWIARFYAVLHSAKPKKEVNRIAAVWHWPDNFNSDELRLAYWGKYFEKDGYTFDNFKVLDVKEFVNDYEKGSWPSRYLFYRRIYVRRWKQFFAMKNYDVVWIDRAFMPFYPFKSAVYEPLIKKMGCHLVMDTTDASDYQGNPDLVLSTLSQADRITAAFKKLVEFYEPKYHNVTRLNWTVPVEGYVVKDDWKLKDPIVIGWMGSPGNFEYLKEIVEQLREVAKETPFVFRYICRIKQDIDIPGATIEHHYYGDDYFDLIGTFDIGLAPFTKVSFATEGKIGMKHQEFMICKIPQVCSPVAISEHAVHEEHVLIAEKIEDWAGLIKRVLSDEALREKLGNNSRALFDEHYHYDTWYPTLKKVLTEF
jgi:glycosyltransferase involved in cell wall biosynthesis